MLSPMRLRIDEVARGLDVPLSTVDRWIRQGRIPIRKNGPNCVFEAAALDRWAQAHSLSFDLPKTPGEDLRPPRAETLAGAMGGGGLLRGVGGQDVPEVLEAAVAGMPFLPEEARTTVLNRLLEREELTSTGVGKGVAIPHPRTPLPELAAESTITTCFLEKPVDYRAVDDRPVFVLFILLSPTVKHHLHLLSRLSFCVRDPSFSRFLDRFLETGPSETEFLSTIERFEAKLDGPDSRP